MNQILIMKTQQKISRKFCVITTQRSGSTWLSSLLDSHPNIIAFDEIFLARTPRQLPEKYYLRFYDFRKQTSGQRPWITFKYLDEFINHYPEPHQFIGFKVMYNHLFHYPEILVKLIQDQYKIIHLNRENHLDIFISSVNSKKHALAHTKTQVQLEAVTLEPAALLKSLKSLEMKKKLAQNFLLPCLPLPKLEISYHSLCTNKNQVLNSITDFLGVEECYESFQSDHQKINKGSYRDKIANYDEIEKVLTGTKYAHFLQEVN